MLVWIWSLFSSVSWNMQVFFAVCSGQRASSDETLWYKMVQLALRKNPITCRLDLISEEHCTRHVFRNSSICLLVFFKWLAESLWTSQMKLHDNQSSLFSSHWNVLRYKKKTLDKWIFGIFTLKWTTVWFIYRFLNFSSPDCSLTHPDISRFFLRPPCWILALV